MKPEVLNNGQIWPASHLGLYQWILSGFSCGMDPDQAKKGIRFQLYELIAICLGSY